MFQNISTRFKTQFNVGNLNGQAIPYSPADQLVYNTQNQIVGFITSGQTAVRDLTGNISNDPTLMRIGTADLYSQNFRVATSAPALNPGVAVPAAMNVHPTLATAAMAAPKAVNNTIMVIDQPLAAIPDAKTQSMIWDKARLYKGTYTQNATLDDTMPDFRMNLGFLSALLNRADGEYPDYVTRPSFVIKFDDAGLTVAPAPVGLQSVRFDANLTGFPVLGYKIVILQDDLLKGDSLINIYGTGSDEYLQFRPSDAFGDIIALPRTAAAVEKYTPQAFTTSLIDFDALTVADANATITNTFPDNAANQYSPFDEFLVSGTNVMFRVQPYTPTIDDLMLIERAMFSNKIDITLLICKIIAAGGSKYLTWGTDGTLN